MTLTIIIAQNTKIPYLTFSWGFWGILGVTLTVIIVVAYIFITNDMDKFGYLYVVQKTARVEIFWCYLAYFILSTLFFTQLYYASKRYLFPNLKDKIRNLNVSSEEAH